MLRRFCVCKAIDSAGSFKSILFELDVNDGRSKINDIKLRFNNEK